MNVNKIYGKLDKADNKRLRAAKIINKADSLEDAACNDFNAEMKLEYMEQLRAEIESKGFENEKTEIDELINKMHNERFEVDDLRKYRILDEKYGEDLKYKQNCIERFMENMEELA